METLEKIFKDTLVFTIDENIREVLDSSIVESVLKESQGVGYALRDFEFHKIKDVDLTKNQYLGGFFHLAIYIKDKRGKIEPLYLDDDKGMHYLTKEGSCTLSVVLPYAEVCEKLGMSISSDYQEVQENFRNKLTQLFNSVEKEIITYDNYEIVTYKHLLDLKDSKEFLTFKQETMAFLKTSKDLFLQSLAIEKGSGEFNITKPKFEFIKNNDLQAVVNISTEVSQIVDGDLTDTRIFDYSIPLETKNKQYFSGNALLDLEDTVSKYTFSHIKEKEIINNVTLHLGYKPLSKVDKMRDLLNSDELNIHEVHDRIIDLLKTSSWVTNKKYLKNIKQFFKITKIVNDMFKIEFKKDKDTYVELALFSGGILLSGKNKGNVLERVYTRTPFKDSISLTEMISILGKVVPVLNWEILLSPYDKRRKTGLENEDVYASAEDTDIENIRKKYGMAKNVNIQKDAKIIGTFRGMPILEGSSNQFLVIFGENSGNNKFLNKEYVIENSNEFSHLGLDLKSQDIDVVFFKDKKENNKEIDQTQIFKEWFEKNKKDIFKDVLTMFHKEKENVPSIIFRDYLALFSKPFIKEGKLYLEYKVVGEHLLIPDVFEKTIVTSGYDYPYPFEKVDLSEMFLISQQAISKKEFEKIKINQKEYLYLSKKRYLNEHKNINAIEPKETQRILNCLKEFDSIDKKLIFKNENYKMSVATNSKGIKIQVGTSVEDSVLLSSNGKILAIENLGVKYAPMLQETSYRLENLYYDKENPEIPLSSIFKTLTLLNPDVDWSLLFYWMDSRKTLKSALNKKI